MQKILLKEYMTDAACGERYQGKFLDDSAFDTLITEDTDGYTIGGQMLFRFRKGAIEFNVLKEGYEGMKWGVRLTEARGTAAGDSFKRIRTDGSVTNTTVNNRVETGAMGYMDKNAMVRYCRQTAFTTEYFKEFQRGMPFVHRVNELYEELCPEHYRRQLNIARGTNRNYVIDDTAFTTVTVNRNFQTAVHKDSGDFPRGFGNLIVYREGDEWTGSYFCLPQYRVAIDLRNTDILFVDVHKWHGNTPFHNFKPAPTPFSGSKLNPLKDYYINNPGQDMRFSFVLYYREFMITCKQPKEELFDTKMEQGGFLKL